MAPVSVIIPIYKSDLTPYEQISLQQCIRVLGKHPIIIVKPHKLDVGELTRSNPVSDVQSFDDVYFQNISGYNKLLCSEFFYERFAAYEYMLICQLDVFIIQDTLLDWCKRGYDYIGAPQFKDIQPRTTGQLTVRNIVSAWFQKPLLNGGLSLRRISACLRLLRAYHRFFKHWPGNEDSFFSLHYPRLLPFRPLMRLPAPEEALSFAIELEPRQSLVLTNGQLPMGGHAWFTYDLTFWRSILLEHGYVV